MGRITSSIGLVSGVPIAETVDKLVALKARPRDLLVKRTEQLRAEQLAVTELTALVVGVEFAIKGLGSAEIFHRRQVSSSDESLITAALTGSPASGSWRFTPVRQAQTHQLLSNGVASQTESLGGGDVTIRLGGFVDKGIALSELNGGKGVERGRIRITDRSGTSEIVDLRFAQTLDDVLTAINQAENISVTAAAEGDRLKLIDHSGQTAANLRVQSVGTSSTAADLGLAGINVAADEVTGADVLRLHDDLALAQLNDGNGVDLRQGVADLEVSLQDGSTLQVDFLAQTKGPTAATAVTESANGIDAQIKFTSLGTGEAFDGYKIRFEDSDNVSVGQETVAINTSAKTLTFKIDAGNTRAADIIAALQDDNTANDFFTASAVDGGDGTGFVSTSDTASTSGGAAENRNERTLGDLLETINSVDPTKLEARISASGDQLELVDLTSGASTLAVSSPFGGQVAEQLGFTRPAVGNVLVGQRRLAGLKTVLLGSLSGGAGVGPLGLLHLTDRSGASGSVDLSTAETLSDVISAINSAAIGIEASINQSRNGLLLTDTSGGSGKLTVANGDGTDSADALGIAIDSLASSVSSGSLDLQTVNRQTPLTSLNRGRGVGSGSFLITDTDGKVAAVNFGVSKPKTLGDVIDLINGLGIGVEARLNSSGDGLLLVDTAHGSGTLQVTDSGKGTAAKDLHIAGSSTLLDVGGAPTHAIDGSTALRVSLDEDETLQDLVDKINAADGQVVASIFNAGGGATPFRLSLASELAGAAGELLVDASQLEFSFRETAAAQDALLLVGSASSPASALVTSATNTFTEVIDGVTLTLKGASTEEVEVAIDQTEQPVVSQLELFVTQYNKLQDKLDEQTAFEEAANATGVLFGSRETLRVQSDLTALLTSRFFGLGSIQSLAELGLSLDDQGKLQFDTAAFRDKLAEDPETVEQFFTDAERGLAARFAAASERLAGVGESVLVGRSSALQHSIDANLTRIGAFNARLERERESLLNEFFRLEETLARLQTSLTAIQQIQILPPLTSLRG